MDSFLDIIASTAGITTAVKIVVDVIKNYAPNDLQPWILPMAALALGLLFAFLLIAAQPETVWNLPTVAAATLRGVFGGIGAVVVTETHKIVRGQQ